MIKTLRFTLMAVMMLICGAISAQEVTLDFTTNDKWKLPTAATRESQGFTDGAYTITLASPSKGKKEGYKFVSYKGSNYLILGKQGATLTLPKFNFAVSKIVVEGNKGASAAVK